MTAEISNVRKFIKEANQNGYHQIIIRTFLIFEKGQEKYTLLLTRCKEKRFADQEEPPGGRVEEGEEIYQAVIREIIEETGITAIEDLEYLGHFDFELDTGIKAREILFKAACKQDNVRLRGTEHNAYRWVNIKEVLSCALHPGFAKVIIDHGYLAKL